MSSARVVGRAAKAFILLAPSVLISAAMGGAMAKPAAAAERLFRGELAIPAGESTLGLLTAELNGDGRPDLAVIGSSSILVFLASSDGIFAPVRPHDAGPAPVDLQTGDLDGDGVLDLAAAMIGEGTVAVLLNRGGGAFEVVERQPVGLAVRAIALGDFDGDRALDVAASDRVRGASTSSAAMGGAGSNRRLPCVPATTRTTSWPATSTATPSATSPSPTAAA
jgi:hypothetical protein